ncbi:Hypothetical protein CINCED_3A001877 [Cinara cedri]|uniref:Uncharacterized protein n=1 Tax=Cinara cedri TaxID=506608 RepID=A0A5E4M1V9_9HEMI|nr:Hypothetical protein CINCED_3A001877 [Cinara cedri]
MKSLSILILTICVSLCVTDAYKLVNWEFDNDTLPEMLPKMMLGKSDEEIQKAVFFASDNQMKIVAEYNGRVYEPDFPYGYFENEISLPYTETFQSETELAFANNVAKGFRNYKTNIIIFKWDSDNLITEVGWQDIQIKGTYVYSNASFYEEGKYSIQVNNLKYQTNTSISGNTMKYPASVPKSSISYESGKVSFSEKISEVIDINSPNVKYFLEDISFQHIADNVAKTMYKNVTIAVRQGIRPYVIFRNVTNTHIKDFTGEFPSGVQYRGGNVVLEGLGQTYTKVKSVKVNMATKAVLSNTEFVLHKLHGQYTLHVNEGKPSAQSASCQYTIHRITMYSTINMLNSTDCVTHINIYDLETVINPALGLALELTKILKDKLVDHYIEKFNSNICSYLALTLNPEAGEF